MNEDSAQRVRRWMPRVWIGYAVVWLVSLALALTVFGGFTSIGQAVPMVLSGVAALLGLIAGWQMRREGRTSPDA